MTPIQIAPESARATITAQVSSDSPHVDQGDVLAVFRLCSTFLLTILAPLFAAVANLCCKNKKTRSTALAVGGLEIRLRDY
jgi:hypothetical protein